MTQDIKDIMLDAALAHVPFDGWSEATFQAAAADAALSVAAARAMFPRGAADLAAAYHRRGDDQMLARMMSEDLSALRYSEKVAAAVRFRLEAVTDKEILRRGMSFYALPQHAAEGAALIWGTRTRSGQRSATRPMILTGIPSAQSCRASMGRPCCIWLGDDIRRPCRDLGVS